MLPIDELIAKADTMSTNLTAVIPQLWASVLEDNLRRKAVLQQSLVVNTDLVGQPGDTVYLPTIPDFDDSGMDLTEDVDMVVNALSNATSVALKPAEKGKAIGITRYALDRMKYDGMAVIVDRLAYAMSLKIENTIAGLWNASVPGTANKLSALYPNGHTSANVAAGDTMSGDFLVDAVAQLKSQNVYPFSDGLFELFLSPLQAKAFLKDPKVRDDIHYSTPETMLRGELGIFHNCRIIETNSLKTATENTQTVYKALLVAPRWAAIAYKRMPEIVIDPTVYDFGRRRKLAIAADFDIELLHNDRGLVLSTTLS